MFFFSKSPLCSLIRGSWKQASTMITIFSSWAEDSTINITKALWEFEERCVIVDNFYIFQVHAEELSSEAECGGVVRTGLYPQCASTELCASSIQSLCLRQRSHQRLCSIIAHIRNGTFVIQNDHGQSALWFCRWANFLLFYRWAEKNVAWVVPLHNVIYPDENFPLTLVFGYFCRKMFFSFCQKIHDFWQVFRNSDAFIIDVGVLKHLYLWTQNMWACCELQIS